MVKFKPAHREEGGVPPELRPAQHPVYGEPTGPRGKPINYGVAKTIPELIEKLKEVNSDFPDATWNGWDDGSLCINNGDNFVGYITGE